MTTVIAVLEIFSFSAKNKCHKVPKKVANGSKRYPDNAQINTYFLKERFPNQPREPASLVTGYQCTGTGGNSQSSQSSGGNSQRSFNLERGNPFENTLQLALLLFVTYTMAITADIYKIALCLFW